MRIKICGIRNEPDLKAALSASPDAVGFLVGQVHPSPDFILACTARRLARSLPPFVQPWIVTHYSAPEEVLEIATDAAAVDAVAGFLARLEKVLGCRPSVYACGGDRAFFLRAP